jgi:hypothetical protein
VDLSEKVVKTHSIRLYISCNAHKVNCWSQNDMARFKAGFARNKLSPSLNDISNFVRFKEGKALNNQHCVYEDDFYALLV